MAGGEPLLAREQERDLLARAAAGDAAALDRLIGAYLRHVVAIARRYRGWGLPMSDLVQDGVVGLLQAVRRFDPEHKVRLSTYAGWWIRSAIQEGALRSWSMVRLGTSNAQRMLAFKLKSMADQLTAANEHLGEDALAWLAERFNTSLAEARRLAERMVARDRSLDAPLVGGGTLVDRLACEQADPEQEVCRKSERKQIQAAIEGALQRLSPREQLVIRKRYFEEVRHTFEAIGRELGISKDLARKIEGRALAKLQTLLPPTLDRASP